MWGTYLTQDTAEFSVTMWSGITDTLTDTAATEGDVIDAGAGDDRVIGSWAGDRIQGGDGKDNLDGLAGDDILEGNDGDDNIQADGIIKAGYLNSVDAASQGNDFVDGGVALIVIAAEHRLSHSAQTVAMHLVASHAGSTRATGRFDARNTCQRVKKQRFQCRFRRSNPQFVHAYSMRLARHKWLGRRMDSASGTFGRRDTTLSLCGQAESNCNDTHCRGAA